MFGLLLKVLIQLQPSWWESFPEFLAFLDQAFGGRNVESLWYRTGAGGKELWGKHPPVFNAGLQSPWASGLSVYEQNPRQCLFLCASSSMQTGSLTASGFAWGQRELGLAFVGDGSCEKCAFCSSKWTHSLAGWNVNLFHQCLGFTGSFIWKAILGELCYILAAELKPPESKSLVPAGSETLEHSLPLKNSTAPLPEHSSQWPRWSIRSPPALLCPCLCMRKSLSQFRVSSAMLEVTIFYFSSDTTQWSWIVHVTIRWG